MQPEKDYRVCDLGDCRLALRDDLVWVPISSGHETYYTVEDPLRSKFYRIGIPEYIFISLLDGRTPISEALAQTSRALPDSKITENDAAAICHWLLQTGLARSSQGGDGDAAATSQSGQARPRATRGTWNPLVCRLPLFHPDGFFNRAVVWWGWICTPSAMAGAAALCLLALSQIAARWADFRDCFQQTFTPLSWLWLPMCWVALRVIHELAHGLVCKKYGGMVREAGILLVLFFPVTYVDVTSSWRFTSKWQRIFTAAAGMYAELAVAAMAALVWSSTGPGELNQLCFQVVIMAGVTTVLFNANFLMKFDGYYMLSDYLEIPNLYQTSQAYLASLLKRLLLLRSAVPAQMPSSPLVRLCVGLYGVAALVWKTVVCAGLLVAASTLFWGAGIILAIVCAGMWLMVPVTKLLKPHLQTGRLRPLLVLNRSHLALAMASSVVALLLLYVPWIGAPTAPAVVDYAPLTVVRAGSAGFVRQLRVRSGQWVEKGRLLVILENEDLQWELTDLDLAVRQSVAKCRMHEHARDVAAWQAELENRKSLDKKYQEKQLQVEKLVVRAPINGQVFAPDLETLYQAYLEAGTRILSIGNPHNKELQVSIPQPKLIAFKTAVGQSVDVRLAGHANLRGRLARIAPRASLECPHPSLYAANGGPLPAQNVHAVPVKDAEAEYELLTPHFTGFVELTRSQSLQLDAGRVARVAVRGQHQPIGKYLYDVSRQWLDRQLRSESRWRH